MIQADNGGKVELISDTITGGAIKLQSSGAATLLQIEGTVTLSASTTTTLTDFAQNAIVSTHDEVAGEATLINKGQISGVGTIGDVNLTLDNYGDHRRHRQPYQRADPRHRTGRQRHHQRGRRHAEGAGRGDAGDQKRRQQRRPADQRHPGG